MQAAISDLSSALVKMMEYLMSGCSAMLVNGYECKQARDYTGASGLACWGHRSDLGTWKLSSFFLWFLHLCHSQWFACLSGSGLLLKSYKTVLLGAEGEIVKLQLLSGIQERKLIGWGDKSMHEISSFLVQLTQASSGQQRSGCCHPSQCYLHWTSMEDASAMKSFILQAESANEQRLLCGHSVTKQISFSG